MKFLVQVDECLENTYHRILIFRISYVLTASFMLEISSHLFSFDS